MPVAVRSYVAIGLALMVTGAVGAAQITPPLQKTENRIVQAAVSLVAAVGNGQACSGYNTEGCDIWASPTYTPVAADPNGSAANIPANLFNAIVSMPRAWVDGLNGLSYALEVTGNWWVYSPTNVLGFDPADPPKITALVDLSIPFKPLSHAIGDQLAWWARSNLPMNASCTGTVGPACSDIGPIFNDMFKAPIWTLASGYQFPTLYNPVSDAEGAAGVEIPGETGQLVPWSGEYVKLNTSDWLTSVVNYLQADPATNAPKPLGLPEIGATLDRFVKALVIAFNPFVPNSYLLKGWPYTALTPLFLPFVPIFCKTCNPDDPGGPPITPAQSAAAEVAPAELVSAKVEEPVASVTVAATAAVDAAAGTGKNDNGSADQTEAFAGVADTTDVPAADTTDVAAADTAGVAAGGVDTSTPASRASAARAEFPDLQPVDVVVPSDTAPTDTAPSDTAQAPPQSVSKPHRGQTRASRSGANADSGGNATSSNVGAAAG